MPNERSHEGENAGGPYSNPAASVVKSLPGIREPSTLAQAIESRLYAHCLSGGPILGPILMVGIRRIVEKALADCLCLDIQGRALALSGWARRRGRSTAIVICSPGRPWLVMQNGGHSPTQNRSPLLGYRAGGAEETLHRRSAAKAKDSVWLHLRRNGWEPASDMIALNDILRLDAPRGTWEDHLRAKMVNMRQGPPYPIRLQRWQLLEIAALFADLPDVHARLAIPNLLDYCDPVLRPQVAENLNVKACEYNFALDASDPTIRARRLCWARTFPAY